MLVRGQHKRWNFERRDNFVIIVNGWDITGTMIKLHCETVLLIFFTLVSFSLETLRKILQDRRHFFAILGRKRAKLLIKGFKKIHESFSKIFYTESSLEKINFIEQNLGIKIWFVSLYRWINIWLKILRSENSRGMRFSKSSPQITKQTFLDIFSKLYTAEILFHANLELNVS